MTDLIGSIIGILLIAMILSPALLIAYMLIGSKVDIDNDGKDDDPYRWQK